MATRRNNQTTVTSQSTAASTAPHSENAALPNRSISPYQGRTAQKDNPTQAMIRQAVDFLTQQVQEGMSETLTAYLAAMSRFRNYSFGNILCHRPTAAHRNPRRRVWGMERTWPVCEARREGHSNSRARHRPSPQERRHGAGAGREAAPGTQIGFRVVRVVDVAQTEGADLPEYDFAITGEAGEYHDRLRDFLAKRGIELEFDERIAPALGVSYGGKIALHPGQPKVQEFVTLVHETAHLCCFGIMLSRGHF